MFESEPRKLKPVAVFRLLQLGEFRGQLSDGEQLVDAQIERHGLAVRVDLEADDAVDNAVDNAPDDRNGISARSLVDAVVLGSAGRSSGFGSSS
ncbi:hypothetical protein R4P47_08080 [Rhodococcus sp. IEGM 1370]|uniref:hypothetical protein n=1 Tax=Rhodococcus sp. IEGM 1370 TaxID=3082222 RepID=UPI002954BE9D|nr:hypothetical protein [Rhodococcus sp. IEGM 1370]MDV8076512.1 hypothetical protein [Rhodococcus sp. IEGM 1370]